MKLVCPPTILQETFGRKVHTETFRADNVLNFHLNSLNIFIVLRVGLEPTLHLWNLILSQAGLPVPPSEHLLIQESLV